MTNNQKISQIETYMRNQMLNNGKDKLYIDAQTALDKWRDDKDYRFTDKDIDTFIMLISGWSAALRKTWRTFIIEKEYEPYMFWNAYVTGVVLGQRLFCVDWWKKIYRAEPELEKRINKTSDPEMIKMIMIGTDWKSLHDKLKGSVKR